jgi:hypothetical protein
LQDRELLENLPGGFRWLQKNVREDVIEDVILYFETMADVLEEKLLRFIELPNPDTNLAETCLLAHS